MGPLGITLRSYDGLAFSMVFPATSILDRDGIVKGFFDGYFGAS
jgi:hypothetical protein